MNYFEKIANYCKERKDILKLFDDLYARIIQLEEKGDSLLKPNDFSSIGEYNKWMDVFRASINSDDEINDKIVRIIVASQYAEMPNNETSISNLEKNIQLNKLNSTHTK